MAKAHLTTKGGAKVIIDGTPEEIATLVDRLEGRASAGMTATRASKPARGSKKPRTTPTNLVSDLIDGGFFRKRKELSAIKLALQEQGHFYPVTTLSAVALRLVRKRQLRRVKDKKRWLYVG